MPFEAQMIAFIFFILSSSLAVMIALSVAEDLMRHKRDREFALARERVRAQRK